MNVAPSSAPTANETSREIQPRVQRERRGGGKRGEDAARGSRGDDVDECGHECGVGAGGVAAAARNVRPGCIVEDAGITLRVRPGRVEPCDERHPAAALVTPVGEEARASVSVHAPCTLTSCTPLAARRRRASAGQVRQPLVLAQRREVRRRSRIRSRSRRHARRGRPRTRGVRSPGRSSTRGRRRRRAWPRSWLRARRPRGRAIRHARARSRCPRDRRRVPAGNPRSGH